MVAVDPLMADTSHTGTDSVRSVWSLLFHDHTTLPSAATSLEDGVDHLCRPVAARGGNPVGMSAAGTVRSEYATTMESPLPSVSGIMSW